MNHSRHVKMDQAYQLEVAGTGEIYGIGLPAHQRAGAHARGPIEAGSRGTIGTSPWASPGWKRRSNLAGLEKGHGVDLVGGKCPGDAVARMNPKLIRQKSQNLLAEVGTLGTHGSLKLRHCRNCLG